MPKFHGQTYRYHTANDGPQTIGVTEVLGGLFAVAWISVTGGRRRVKSSRLPVITDADRLQKYLDAWAAERRLEVA